MPVAVSIAVFVSFAEVLNVCGRICSPSLSAGVSHTGTMIAGWNAKEEQPELYFVDDKATRSDSSARELTGQEALN